MQVQDEVKAVSLWGKHATLSIQGMQRQALPLMPFRLFGAGQQHLVNLVKFHVRLSETRHLSVHQLRASIASKKGFHSLHISPRSRQGLRLSCLNPEAALFTLERVEPPAAHYRSQIPWSEVQPRHRPWYLRGISR